MSTTALFFIIASHRIRHMRKTLLQTNTMMSSPTISKDNAVLVQCRTCHPSIQMTSSVSRKQRLERIVDTLARSTERGRTLGAHTTGNRAQTAYSHKKINSLSKSRVVPNLLISILVNALRNIHWLLFEVFENLMLAATSSGALSYFKHSTLKVSLRHNTQYRH
jgi:hypothetical protein